MSTTRTSSRWVYDTSANGNNFIFDNLVQSPSDMVVSRFEADGTPLALPPYTVTGIGKPTGGTIVFESALEGLNGSILVIERQTTRVTVGGDPADYVQDPAAARKYNLDQRLLLSQEHYNRLKRSFAKHPTEPDGPLLLPPVAVRRLKMLAFDEDGNPIASNLTLSEIEAGAGGGLPAVVVDDLINVNQEKYSSLEVAGDFTPAAEAALADAVASKLEGIYFPARDAPYGLKDCNVPANMRVVCAPGADIGPAPDAAIVFICDGDNITFERVNCVGIGVLQVNDGVGAVLTCQLSVVSAGPPIAYGLTLDGDSLVDDLAVPDWAPNTDYDQTSEDELTPGDIVRRPGAVVTYWICLQSHHSDSEFMINDIRLGYWGQTTVGMNVDQGGSGYVATVEENPEDDPQGVGGWHFDYEVTTWGGSDGVIRCYVDMDEGSATFSQITRIRTISQGSGYRSDHIIAGQPDPRLIMTLSRPSPTNIWIQAIERIGIRVRDSRFLYGTWGLAFTRCTDVEISRNYLAFMGPPGNGIGIYDCTNYLVADNRVEEMWGQNSPCGIRLTAGNPVGVVHNGVIRGNKVRACDQGISSNIGIVKSLTYEGNHVEQCVTHCFLLKHGFNANAFTAGTADEHDVGLHGITFAGNVARVDTGTVGFHLHNNLRDIATISLDGSNVTECVGDKKTAKRRSTVGVGLINVANSNISPTVVGRFGIGISIRGAWHTTFAPTSDGRCETLISAPYGYDFAMHTCRFPGSYVAAMIALWIRSATKPIFAGTNAIVRGRPIGAITITAAGSGGPANAEIPVYANGGGYGLQIKATVVAGVITAAYLVPTVQEFFYGIDYFDGRSGTFPIKVKQNGGSGAVIQVTIVNGEVAHPPAVPPATKVTLVPLTVLAGGSGYLKGGSTTSEGLLIEFGSDFVGSATTDATGKVVSTMIYDAGGHFRDVPDLVLANGDWPTGTPPTLTAVLDSTLTGGAVLENVYGGQITNGYFEGGLNGLETIGDSVIGLDILDSQFSADAGQPLKLGSTIHLGLMSGITQISSSSVFRTDGNRVTFAMGNGVDDTAALASAIAAAYGSTLVLMPGTYIISTLTLTNDIRIEGYGATIKVKDNCLSTNLAFVCSGTGKQYAFRGIEFDSNEANQPVPNTQSMIRFSAVGGTTQAVIDVQECVFINGSGSADLDVWSNEYSATTVEMAIVKNNRFIGGRETGVGANSQPCGYVTIRTNVEGEVSGNDFDLTHAPLINGRKGLHLGITSGLGASIGARFVIANNRFNYCGTNDVAGLIGSLDVYSFCYDLVISGNIVRNTVTRGINVKADSRNVTITGNVCEGTFPINGDSHITLNASTTSGIINGNIVIANNVSDGAALHGIAVTGYSGVDPNLFATGVIVANNVIRNAGSRGIHVGNVRSANVTGNFIHSCNSGITGSTIQKHLEIANNNVRNLTNIGAGQPGVFIDSASLNATVAIVGNSFSFDTTAVSFTGSIDGTTLTVTAVASGQLDVGQTIAGAGVAANTRIVSGDTSTGGVGTFTVSVSQSVGSTAMTGGWSAATRNIIIQRCSGGLIADNYATGMGVWQMAHLTDVSGPMLVTGNMSDTTAANPIFDNGGTFFPNPYVTLGTNYFRSSAFSGSRTVTAGSVAAEFIVGFNDSQMVNNKAGAACVFTLPTATGYPGREIVLINWQAQTVDSASANVVPLTGGAAATNILPATAGKWARIKAVGANWNIVAAG